MGGREKHIRCRKCNETISLDNSSCPHCGTSIRSRVALLAVAVIGVVVVVASLLSIAELWLFGLVGTVVALGSGALLYDRQERVVGL